MTALKTGISRRFPKDEKKKVELTTHKTIKPGVSKLVPKEMKFNKASLCLFSTDSGTVNQWSAG